MDTNSTSTANLSVRARLLFDALAKEQKRIAGEVAALDLLIREAQTREHRRAAYNNRDRACYRMGGAFEPVGALDLDDVQVTGFLGLGTLGVLLLAGEALANPALSIADLLAKVFRSDVGRFIRAHGVRLRWGWLQAMYLAETEAFARSKKGQDPKARWRTEKPTVNQIYLTTEICRLLQIVIPRFENSGAAYDWIEAQAGNPRFWQAPPAIDLSAIEAQLK